MAQADQVYKDRLLVAAIDFGTTYSGYAFSFRHDFERDPLKIQANQSWSAFGSQGLVSWKTPTTVLLKPDGSFDSFGYEAEDNYYELAEREEHRQWYFFKRFKMLLHGKNIQRGTIIYDAMEKPMPAMKVFAFAIDYLRRHLLQMITNRGLGLVNNDINWVLTVPAIWNEPAKQFMREAAVQGGIPSHQLKLALEPEAASLYCNLIPQERVKDQLGPFSPQTVYMVLDCGGGTVDVTVHEVMHDMTLKEILRASGGAWGGTKVDASYIELFENMFGKQIMTSFIRDNKIDHLDLMRDFEIKKRKCTPEMGSMTIRMSVALSEYVEDRTGKTVPELIAESSMADKISVRRDRMTISGDVMQQMFSEALNSIISHVKDVCKNPKIKRLDKILMVGGFSESMFIFRSIKEAFPNVQVVQPDDPGLVVLKGAVIFGHMPDAISSRVVQCTYGVSVTTDFDETIHPKENMVRSKTNEIFCKKAFSKFITVDEDVKKDKVICKTYDIRERHSPISIDIMVSPLDNPVVTNHGCTKLGTVTVKCPIGGWRCNSKLRVEFRFGGTEFSVRAVEEITCIEQEAVFDFLQ